MNIDARQFDIKGLSYTIRSAIEHDAPQLSTVRLQIDGETENLDREKGEGFIDTAGFEQLISADTDHNRSLFLVAEADGSIVGFSRCAGSSLKRLAHKVEFGVCVCKNYWGYAIGKHLLQTSIEWAEANTIEKISLQVLETNEKAIALYKSFGFELEGVLKKDKLLADGNYYNTILMGRCRE